jgi:hypothetical protein
MLQTCAYSEHAMPLDDLIFFLVEACKWVGQLVFLSLGELMEIEKRMAFSGCIFY